LPAVLPWFAEADSAPEEMSFFPSQFKPSLLLRFCGLPRLSSLLSTPFFPYFPRFGFLLLRRPWVSISVGDIPVDTEIEIPLRVTFFAIPEGQRLSIDGEVTYLTPTGKLLSTQLNKVTVRYVEESKFQFQQGTAIPVVEKVFHHLQASYIIDVSRASELNFESGRIMQEAEASTLRQYSRLLGEKTGKEIDDKLYGSLNIINVPASTRKSRVADAVGFIRKAKKFDQ